jgi:hypothetical protein
MNRISVENPDDDDDRIYLTRPVTVRRLSQILGVKPHVMLAELMMLNVFCTLRDIVEDSIAKQVAKKYHRILIIRDEDPEY